MTEYEFNYDKISAADVRELLRVQASGNSSLWMVCLSELAEQAGGPDLTHLPAPEFTAIIRQFNEGLMNIINPGRQILDGANVGSE